MKTIGKADYSKYIVPAAIVVGGYLVLKNLGLFGSAANSGNNAGVDSTTAAGVTAALNQAKNSGDFATLNSAQVPQIAASIYNAGIASPVDQDTIQDGIIQANTLTDLLNIIQAFGTKQAADSYFSTCSMLGFNCQSYDLRSWIRASLDASHLASVNGYFSNMGINYQF